MKMRNLLRAGLLVGTSTAALGMAGALGPAQAFEEVNWTWTKSVVETVNLDYDSAASLNPTGLTQLENVQMMIGDVSASDHVGTVVNNQPGEGSGGTTQSGSFTFFTEDYEGDDDLGFSNNGNGDNGEITGQSGALSDAGIEVVGSLDETAGSLTFTADISDIPATIINGDAVALDAATELPEVSSTATALANQRSIDSEVSTGIHDGQFAFGGFSSPSGELPAGVPDAGQAAVADVYENGSENEHFSTALALVTAGSFGLVEPASISAVSTVESVTNASVSSSAQALANVHDVEVDAATASDAVLVADVTQAAYADVSASADVQSVEVSNYTGLGGIDGPLVDSQALAAGNISSVTVSTPDLDLD